MAAVIITETTPYQDSFLIDDKNLENSVSDKRHTHMENMQVRVLVYLIPALCALAFVNNGAIISVAAFSRQFQMDLFPSVRLLYAAIAAFDIFGVITYQFVEWLGK